MKVERWDLRREGPPTEAALRHKLEGLGYVVDVYRYPPGTFFDTHAHAVDKIDAVVSGSFRVTMEDDSIVLGAGDAVWVPKGTPHSAEVVGDLSVVSLDAVKAH